MRKKLAKWVTNVLLITCVLALSIGLMACGNVSGTQSGSESAPNSQTSATCNHQVVVDERVEPTCEESGLTSGAHCAICGEVFTQQEEIPANGHNFSKEYSFNGNEHWFECDCGKKNEQSAHEYEWEIVIDATEESDGLKIGACVCGREKTQVIPSKEHEHSYSATVTTPTCTEDGFTTYECACGDSYVTDIILAGHSFSEAGYVAVLPGQTLCEHGGALIQKCKNCGEVREVEEIAPQGHAVDTWIITAPTNGTGRATADCKRCGVYLSVNIPTLASDIYNVETVRLEELCTQEIKTTYTLWANYLDEDGKLLATPVLSKEAGNGALEIRFEVIYANGYHTLGGHLMIETIIDADLLESLGGVEFPLEKATCTAFGFGSYVCDECGAEMSIPTSRTHNYETDNIAEENVITKPTCDLPGKAEGICTVCEQEGRFDIPAMGHELTFIPSADNKRLTIICSNYAEGLVARPCAFHSGVTYAVVGTPEIVAATCQEAGSITFKYDDNGTIKTITLELATTGHKCGDVVVKPNGSISVEDLVAGGGSEFPLEQSTCTKDGRGFFVCSYCEQAIYVTTLAHGKHSFDEDTYVAPTCTTAGKGTCTSCGLSDESIVPALGHEYELKVEKLPTATETGLAKVVCTREENGCGHIVIHADVSLPVLGDSAYEVEHEVLPTCSSVGNDIYTIHLMVWDFANGLAPTTVAYSFDVQVATIGHTLNKETMGTKAPWDTTGITEFPLEKATCTSEGRGYYTCEVCKQLTYVYTYKTSHEWNIDEPVAYEGQEPTCTEPGLGTAKCYTCDETIEVVIPATGHPAESLSYNLMEIDGEVYINTYCLACGMNELCLLEDEPVIVEATCQEAGSITYKYSYNGTIKTITLELATTGHKCGDVVVKPNGSISVEDLVAGGGQEFTNQKSDCGHTGLGQFNCSYCGESILVETEINGEHKIDTEAESYRAPTCTAPGTGYCSVCRLSSSDLLPALGHAYKYVESVDQFGTITLTVTCEREGTEFGCDALVDVFYTINLSELLANIDYEKIFEISKPSCTTEGVTEYHVTLENVLDAKGEPVTYVHEVKIAKENHILNGKEVPHNRIDAEYFVSIGGQEFPTQQATCAKNGVGQYVCDVCGNSILVETTGESRHLYGEEPVIVLPGCTEPGSEIGICVRPGCLTSETGMVEKVLPALGHTYQIEVKIVPTHSYGGEAVITCAGRANAEGELVCDTYDPVEIRISLPAIDSAPTGYYNSLGKTAPTCSEAGQEKYVASIKVAGIKQRFDIEFAIITPALGHVMPDVEERLEWTTEKIVSVYVVDETGRIMKDEYGNAITYDVLVEERYVGFTCDTCMSMFVISLKTFVNGHEVHDLYTVVYREVSKVIVDAYGNEETKIFAEYVMECVDYNADCIETNHEVIISSYELN